MKSFAGEFIKESSTLRVKISFEKEIFLHSLLLPVIIRELKKVLDEAACEILRWIFHAIDDRWLEERDKVIRICKTVKGRTIRTVFGTVSFDYRQARKDGKYLCPLLETLGIGKYQRLTEDFIDLVKRSALYTSYRKALKIGGDICALSTLWSFVQNDGVSYRKNRDDAVYYYLEGDSLPPFSPQDFAIVMIDEIWLRAKRTGSSDKKKREYIKVKVARCSVARKKGDSYEWEPLRIMATARGDQKHFLGKARKFFNATIGLHQVPRIMVLTDGCPMGKSFCALYPGKAIWQLDWWHLFNRIHKGCAFEKDLEQEVCGLVRVEKLDAALGLLYAYREAMKCMEKKLEETIEDAHCKAPSLITPKVFLSTRQRTLLEQCITYLENNREGIYGVKAYAKELPAEYLAFGTGPLERLQAVMIAYRMKKQGKHWSIDGADNLIQLLSREWNGEALERVIDEGLAGLSEWEELCTSRDLPEDHEARKARHASSKTHRRDFSPLPGSCLVLLKRGKNESFFTPLKSIGHLKLVPHIVDCGEEGCRV
jgi:hypothetical protein